VPIVCFEGVNGAGKQAQINQLETLLQKYGHRVAVYHDPGISEQHPCSAIREAVLYGGPWKARYTALLLIMAAKCELQHEINSFLHEDPDAIVILDRYLLSTYVYQTLGLEDQGLSREDAFSTVSDLCNLVSLRPVDLLILLNADPMIAYRRRVNSASRIVRHDNKDDRFEEQGLSFAKRLAARYLSIVDTSELRDSLCHEHVIVDIGERNPEEVFEAWWALVGGDTAFRFNEHGGYDGVEAFRRRGVRV